METEMPCMRCFGSGWEDKKFVPFSPTKQVYVLIPCKMCSGKGRIDIKQEESNGGEPRDIL